MKVIRFHDVGTVNFALSEIAVIYQTPTWNQLGSKNDNKGRTLNGFLLIDKGECYYEWDGGSANLKHGGLIYLGAGSKKVVTVTKRPFSFYRICFVMTDVESKEQIIFDENPWVVFDFASKNLFNICEEMLDSTLSDNRVFKSKALMYEFFYALTKQIQPLCASRISAAREYIECHYAEKFEVASLAQMCHLGETQFFNLFKNEVCMSPIKYKNYLRVERAKMLVLSGECSLAEIADMLGFENVYYFGRIFKEYTGVSPAKYQSE